MSSYTNIAGATDAQNSMLASIAQKFEISDSHLLEISTDVYNATVGGLNSDGAAEGLPDWVSYVKYDTIKNIRRFCSSGKTVLGLTINTSTKRIKVANITFHKEGDHTINKQIFFPPKTISKVEEFFDRATTAVADFINTHNLVLADGQKFIPMGVTVDLPIRETGETKGRVVGSGLGKSSIFEGVDLADGLNAELNKKHLPVRIVCVTNSSISTMVLSQFRFQHTSVALVLNHGINAAYYESANKIPKIADRALAQIPSRIAINTELAAYGKNSQVLKPTMWDNRINRESDNPQEHIFEKMVADKYLGEIVRNLVTDFMDAQILFPKNADVSTFSEPFSFFTSYMTIMEDTSESLDEVGTLLSASFNVQASKVDRCIVSALCSIVSRRAARLMGAATAALVKRATEAMDEIYPAVVSVSGQLTEMNQPYVQTMIDTATSLVDKMGLQKPTFNVLGEDGYTVGAAIAAMGEE